MANRIAQFWTSIDTLLASSSPAAQREGERLAACPFTAHHPLEVYLDRKYLKAVIGVSIRQMQRHLADIQDGPVRLQLTAEIARREAMLQWLSSEGDTGQVYMHLYPGAEYPMHTPQPMTTDDDTPSW